MYLFSTVDNEELSSKNKTTNSITNHRSKGPIAAAASRLVSSVSKKSNNSLFKNSNDTNEKVLLSNFRTSQSNPHLINSFQTIHNSSNLNNLSTISTNLMIPTPETIDIDCNFEQTYTQTRELIEINHNYFSQQKHDICRRFERLFIQLSHTLELSLPLIRYIIENFHHFDYSSEIRANGYRTIVVSHGHACLRTLNILQHIDKKRDGLLFNLMHASRLFQELESWTKALIGMQRILAFAVKIITYTEKKQLYVDVTQVPMDIELDYFKMVACDSENFFGRTCGFQFADSVGKTLTFLLAGLAAYNETYHRSIPIAAGVAIAPKYMLFPEQRAAKCAAALRDCDYLFCQSFWNLLDHDVVKKGSRYIVPHVTVSKYFQIGPEPIEIDSIIILPPTAGPGSDEPNERLAGNIGAGSDNRT
ncbi:unnamed protein product, partial [Rotaria sp. Silwood1]